MIDRDGMTDWGGAGYAKPKTAVLMCGYLGPGGAERQICILAQGLLAAGWQVRVLPLTLAQEGAHYAPLIRRMAIPLLPLDEHNPDWRARDLARWRRVARLKTALPHLPPDLRGLVSRAAALLLRDRPELLISYLDLSNMVAGMAGLLAGVPRILLSGRNLAPTHFPAWHQPWFRDLYRRMLASPRLTLMTNSHAGAQSYAQWLDLPPASIPVVQNGLSPAFLPDPAPDSRARIRAELGMAADAPLILGLFRLAPEKRPDLFLRLIKRLAGDFPTLRAAIAGQGPLQTDLQDQIRHDAIPATLLGTRHDVPALLSAADLLLHTAQAEGVPNAVIEAQWLGCPIVASRGGGTAEILTEVQIPLLHDLEDEEGLYRSCRRLLADPALAIAVGQEAQRQARQRFSVETLTRQTLDLVRPITKPRRWHPPTRQEWADLLGLAKIWWRRYRRPTVAYSRILDGIWHDHGHAFIAPLPQAPVSDQEGLSELVLYEDETPLSPGHCSHDEIRQLGQGRYSHWGNLLYFSSSDNSDPGSNGRTYRVAAIRKQDP